MFFAPAIRKDSTLPALGAMNGSFERFMNDVFGGLQRPWHGLEEDEKSWTVTLDVPGVAREHLSVTTEGMIVRIETRPEAGRQLKAMYELPQEINPDACEARLENGVLTLKLGKVEQAITGRQIAVN